MLAVDFDSSPSPITPTSDIGSQALYKFFTNLTQRLSSPRLLMIRKQDLAETRITDFAKSGWS